MSFTLYGDLGSGAFSAEAALAEAGAPYRFELVSLDKNEQKQPAFLAINPSGKMPAFAIAGRRYCHRVRRHSAHPGRSLSPSQAVAAAGQQ
jgi:glutathione S-transferase